MEKDLKKIQIEIIPHSQQRYPTVGDYWEENGVWHLRISEMADWRYKLLVAIHELAEMALAIHRNILEKDISDFDVIFETERAKGLHGVSDEPGNDSRVSCGWIRGICRSPIRVRMLCNRSQQSRWKRV